MEKYNVFVANRALSIIYSFFKHLKEKQKDIEVYVSVVICLDVYKLLKQLNVKIIFLDLANNNHLDLKKLYSLQESNKNIKILLYSHTYGNEFTPAQDFKKLKKLNKINYIIDDRCLCWPNTNFPFEKSFSDLTVFSTGIKKQVESKVAGGFSFSSFFFPISPIDFNNIGKIEQVKWNQPNISRYFDDILYEGEKVHDLKSYRKLELEKNTLHLEQLKSEFNFWRFNLVLPNKEIFLEQVFSKGLFASSHYKLLEENTELFHNAYYLHSKVVNIIYDKYLSDDGFGELLEIIRHFKQ